MSSVSSISMFSGPSLAAAASQPSLTSLKSQMSLYSQYANGSGPAASDYKALQIAIQSQNISDAQAALARLRRDSASAGEPLSGTANSTTTAPADSDGDNDNSGSAGSNAIINMLA